MRAEGEKRALQRRVVGPKRSANGKNLRIMMLFGGAAFGRVVQSKGQQDQSQT